MNGDIVATVTGAALQVRDFEVEPGKLYDGELFEINRQ
jgi:hypothetical protein